MSAFKEQIEQDILDVFIDFDEFGTVHNFQGNQVLIVQDNDLLRRRGDKTGIDLGDVMFFVKEADLDFVPQPDADVNFDGRHMIITDCKLDDGMYAITLRQNR